MAHKLKTRRVPHIRKDGKVGTKKDYRVVCKRRGQVCCDETFTTQREADAYIEKHWDYVNHRKSLLSALLEEKRGWENTYMGRATVKVTPDITEFRNTVRGATARYGAEAA